MAHNLELNKIHRGDCFELIKLIPDKSVDLIVIDPPYGIDFYRAYGKNKGESIVGDSGFDIMVFLDDLLSEFKRILKEGSAIYCFTRFDVYPYLFIKFKKYFNIKNQIIWHKGRETTGMGDRRGNYANNYESILYAVNGRHILKKPICGSVWSFKLSKNKYHMTEKPLDIIKEILTFSSCEGDTILDCFMGSGTTAVACNQLGRNFIGFEISQEYVDICNKRLEQGNIKEWF